MLLKEFRIADGTPLALERVALLTQCAAVLNEDLSRVDHFMMDYVKIGFQPTIASGWLKARLATAQEARKLDLPSKSPLLVETRVIEDENGVSN